MAKWEQLVAAREQRHLSQLEAAEYLNVGIVTYQRWEAGKAKPQPQHMRRLYEVFGTILHQKDDGSLLLEEPMYEDVQASCSAAFVVGDSPEELFIGISTEEMDEPQAFIASNMTTYLWSLAFAHAVPCDGKGSTIRQAIKEFDRMNTTNKNYQMTRREALCSLATLPIITLGLTTPGSVVPPSQYGATLAHCAASLEACWELSKSSEASDLALAFKCVSRYLPMLTTIVKESAPLRKEAVRLVTQAYLLKHVLGLHVEGPDVAIAKGHARLAVMYGEQSDDLLLQLTALRYMTWGYDHAKNYQQALKTVEQAQHLITHASPPPPPVVTSAIYSTLAVMQARNGISPTSALGHAQDTFPTTSANGSDVTTIDFGYAKLMRNNGLAHYYQERHKEALGAFAQAIDPNDLSPKVPMAARLRVELLNRQTMSALKSPNRDREQVIAFWKAGLQGAITLQSQQRFDEACMAYEIMTGIWPADPSIRALRDLIQHW